MLKKYKSAFISPIIVMLVFGVFFALNGFFPFGKSSVSWCDMTQQVIPLLCDFKDMLSGNDGFFLSLNNAGGMNFFGVFFFFLASPFSFLVAFVEKADIPYLVNIILVLKLCVCAITASIYFEKRFTNLCLIQKVAMAVSFALCGYGMLFYQNIIWLDVMYLFPLLMLGIHSLIEKGKPALLIITLAANVIVNFYISYMVILFVVLYFGINLIYSKGKDYTLYFKLGISALISLMISAVVWVPSFAQYASSGRKGNIVEGLMQSDFFAHLETTVPLLLATSLVFSVFVVFLPSLESKEKAVKISVAAFIAMCIPIFIEPINLMWHTGDYMAFPTRYGFITIFLGFVVCGELLNNAEYAKGKLITNIIVILASLATGLFAIWYTKKHIDTLTHYANTLWGDKNSYKGILTLFAVVLVAGVLVVLLTKKKLVCKQVLAVSLAVIVLCEGYSSLMIYVAPVKDDFNVESYTEFCELKTQIDDDGFYRVNMSEKLIDANMTGAIGFGSLGHYTSLTNAEYMNAIKALGYSGYWMEIGNWGGNIISDALMSVKYNINRNNDGFYIEQNPISLGLTVPCANELPEYLPKSDRAIVAGEMFKKAFALKENPVTRYEITDFGGCDYENINNVYNFTKLNDDNFIEYEITVKGEQTLYFDCFDGGSNSLEEPVNNAFVVYVGSFASYYPTQTNNGMLELGTFKNTKVTVWLRLTKDVSCYSFGVYGFDTAKINNAVKNFEASDTTIKPNCLTTQIPQDHSGQVFISLPYNEGYKVTLNGEKIEYNRCLTGFMSVDVESGGELKITFTPPKFILGLVISLLGIVAFILLCVFKNKIESAPRFLKIIAVILFAVVFTVFIIAIYVAPTIINLIYK